MSIGTKPKPSVSGAIAIYPLKHNGRKPPEAQTGVAILGGRASIVVRPITRTFTKGIMLLALLIQPKLANILVELALMESTNWQAMWQNGWRIGGQRPITKIH